MGLSDQDEIGEVPGRTLLKYALVILICLRYLAGGEDNDSQRLRYSFYLS